MFISILNTSLLAISTLVLVTQHFANFPDLQHRLFGLFACACMFIGSYGIAICANTFVNRKRDDKHDCDKCLQVTSEYAVNPRGLDDEHVNRHLNAGIRFKLVNPGFAEPVACPHQTLHAIKSLMTNNLVRQVVVSSEMLVAPEIAIPYQLTGCGEFSFFKRNYTVDKPEFVGMIGNKYCINLGDIVFAYEVGKITHLLPLNDSNVVERVSNKLAELANSTR